MVFVFHDVSVSQCAADLYEGRVVIPEYCLES